LKGLQYFVASFFCPFICTHFTALCKQQICSALIFSLVCGASVLTFSLFIFDFRCCCNLPPAFLHNNRGNTSKSSRYVAYLLLLLVYFFVLYCMRIYRQFCVVVFAAACRVFLLLLLFFVCWPFCFSFFLNQLLYGFLFLFLATPSASTLAH